MSEEQIGYILRANTSTAVSGMRISGQQLPALGSLVKVQQDSGVTIYGLIYDLKIEDDGLVRQLVTSENIRDDVVTDNRRNRTVPVEISILLCGYKDGRTYHLLPPRPPLSLDKVFLCGQDEVCAFTNAGRFGYFRHILRGKEFAIGEILALHLNQVQAVQENANWIQNATRELITLLRDDYPSLMDVLGALGDTNIYQVEG